MTGGFLEILELEILTDSTVDKLDESCSVRASMYGDDGFRLSVDGTDRKQIYQTPTSRVSDLTFESKQAYTTRFCDHSYLKHIRYLTLRAKDRSMDRYTLHHFKRRGTSLTP